MILYSEIMAWIVRASLFCFWFTGLTTDALLDGNSKGMLQGFTQKYMAFILVGLVANFAINGFPRLLKENISTDNLILIGEFKAGLVGTMNFLLQGSKVEKVIRNLVQLSGKKNVYISIDRTKLFINNAYKPKMHDYFIIAIQLSLSILLLLSSPFLMVLIFTFVKYLLMSAHITLSIAGPVVKTLTLLVFGYYFYPYFITSSRYSFNVIRYVIKPLGKYFGYSTFSSPLLTFINSKNEHLMGAVDKRKNIYVNTDYIDNNKDLFKYIVAHEAGHINERLLNLIKVCLAPILYPWLIFMFVLFGIYFSGSDNIYLGNSFNIIVVTMVILTTFTHFNIQKLGEFRADEYAVRKLGITHVKRILQELDSKSDGRYSPLSSAVSFSKRLERIMSKKWES